MRAVVSTDGVVHTVEKEAPVLQPHFVLVDTVYSAISPGTEMSMQQRYRGRSLWATAPPASSERSARASAISDRETG